MSRTDTSTRSPTQILPFRQIDEIIEIIFKRLFDFAKNLIILKCLLKIRDRYLTLNTRESDEGMKLQTQVQD
jgi:hypothetical protein